MHSYFAGFLTIKEFPLSSAVDMRFIKKSKCLLCPATAQAGDTSTHTAYIEIISFVGTETYQDFYKVSLIPPYFLTIRKFSAVPSPRSYIMAVNYSIGRSLNICARAKHNGIRLSLSPKYKQYNAIRPISIHHYRK